MTNETRVQELVGDELHEVISSRPHWFVRKGSLIFLFIIVLLLSLTWFIKYPDIINASARLVAINPPKPVIARSDGKIIKLFVTNEEQVHKKQHLGYAESTAAYSQVMNLQTWINNSMNLLGDNAYDSLVAYSLPQLSDLGELQTAFQALQDEYAEIRQTVRGGYYQQKKNALQKDMQYLGELKNNSFQQQELLEQDRQVHQKEYEAYESLANDKVIAPMELNFYKSRMIEKDQALKRINAQITSSEISRRDKQNEIIDLQKVIVDQEQKFKSALLEMKSEIEKWIQEYVWVAPEDGKVVFISSLQENEVISTGQQLFYIEPIQTQVYAESMAPQKGLGKIKQGQRVILRVESYPSNEYGYLSGIIGHVSVMPNRNDSFLLKINLPGGLTTSYGKTIFFRNNFSARAEIITDERKLFDRFLGGFNNILER